MKIGKYTIQDEWVPYSNKDSEYIVYFKYVTVTNGFPSNIQIFKPYNDVWIIAIQDPLLNDTYKLMYGTQIESFEAPSHHLAEVRVDTFLHKLDKLKVFL